MNTKKGLTIKKKTEIMIAVLLICCLLLGVAVMVLIEKFVGTPVYYNGEMKNICVRITEICSSNSSVIATDNGEFPDYIELYNYGETFNLADFGLANDTSHGKAYTFGDIEFKADSYLIIYLDGINVPFRLSSQGGEYIALVAWDGTVIDKATTVATGSNQVMLWNGSEFSVTDEASPGYPNTEEGLKAFRAGVADDSFSLVINEIITANGSVLPDSDGDFVDIIELKNNSSAIISTKGYFVSDTHENRSRCALPERQLAPGEIMLVFASGKDKVDKYGEFHADFKLSLGESVIIFNSGKYTAQDIDICETNYSQSRTETDSGVEYTVTLATPGFENTEAGVEALELSRINVNAEIVISEILLSSDLTPYGGKLRDVIELCNISDKVVSTKGWYISDSQDEPYKFALPVTTLNPNDCLVLYAENGVGENVCGFALSSSDSLYLTAPNYKRSEYVSCVAAGRGQSKIRVTENQETIYISGDISIGYANDSQGSADYAAAVRPDEIEISEVVSMNSAYLPGPYKTYHDFIELHNRTENEIDLSGWYISDDTEQPRKGSLNGLKIPANGYAVVILSSDGLNTPSGYLTARFSVSASGETLVLSKGDEIIDAVAVPSLGENTSYGRAKDCDGFSIISSPTPNAANGSAVAESAISPTASIPQGVYDSGITVSLSGEGDIYYTLDCSEPSAASTLYTQPIQLSSTSVIRCCSVATGKRMSEITDLTYIINEADTLEAVSIVTTPENLWDYYTGIYETGPKAESVFPYNGANYYNRWERDATVSFFDKYGGGFSENCGIRIFGGLSRALPKKSFALFFRTSYGAGALNYQLFEDDELSSYEAFVLRNTGQDWKYSSMRDAMITSIANDYLGIDIQNCRPVVLYLNGEYWGIYFIREKLNQNYVAGHYNVDASEAQVAVANGHNNTDYQALVDYASSHDLSIAEHYDYVCTLMDVNNYADYIAAQMIIANTDNGNIRFFTYEGGKWRWIMYDVDQSFRTASYNTIAEHLNPKGTGGGDKFSTRLINALLKNPEFKKMFLEKVAYQVNNIWNEEVVGAYVDEFSAMIINDMAKECARWEKDYGRWESSVKSLNTFIAAREDYVIQYISSYFALSESEMRSYGFNV